VCIAKALMLADTVAYASDFVSVFSIAGQAILTLTLSLFDDKHQHMCVLYDDFASHYC
jgi:hypothetical protein